MATEIGDLGFRLRYAIEQATKAMAEFNAVTQEARLTELRRWQRIDQERAQREAQLNLDYAAWKEANGHA